MRQKIGKLIQRPELVFLILASVFGVLSAIMVPQLSVSDENMHFLRSYSIASGSIGAQKCNFPNDVRSKASNVYLGDYSSNYANKIDFSKISRGVDCGSAASYSPIMHIPQAIGVLLGKLIYPSPGVLVLLGRLFNLAFYITALFYIIKFTRLGKWSFVVIGLFPEMIHIAASVSSDVMNNVIVFAASAIIFNLFSQATRISRKQTIILLVAASLLALTKLTNVLLLIPLLFLPSRLFRINRNTKLPFNVHKWGILSLSGIVGCLSALVWQKIYGAPLVSSAANNPLVDYPIHFITILFHTYIDPVLGYNDVVLRGTVGEFSSFRYHLPTMMVVLCFVLLFTVLIHRNRDEEKSVKAVSKRLAFSSAGALLTLVTVISYALYTNWAIQPFRLGPGAPYADGVQGRYFTAAFVMLVPLFIWLRKYISITTKSKQVLGMLVFSCSGFLLLFYILETFYVYR